MNVITLEKEAFYKLVAEAVQRVKKDLGAKPRDKWIDGEEAMRMLRITSKTTLQKLRYTGEIRYAPIMPKVILYDADSIDAYIERHAKKHILMEDEKVDTYTKLGFDHGYWLQKGDPKALAELMERANKTTTYYQAMVAGKKEAEKEAFLERMNTKKDKDRDQDHER